MILATILSSLFTIYPWNVGGSVYGTSGEYSDGGSRHSTSAYFSMDRRSKDGFVIGYEDLMIKKDDETYRQFNWVGRDIFWIKPSLRLVGLIGHLQSSNSDDAWLGGGKIEGDLPWLKYSAGYVRSDYQLWLPYSLRDAWKNIIIDQVEIQISRKLGPIVMRLGAINQTMGDTFYSMNHVALVGKIKNKITGSFLFSAGESLYAVDTDLLIINNNPEILTQSMAIRATYKLNPNIYISGIWAQHKYNPYDIQYLSIGLSGRF